MTYTNKALRKILGKLLYANELKSYSSYRYGACNLEVDPGVPRLLSKKPFCLLPGTYSFLLKPSYFKSPLKSNLPSD